MMDLTILSAKKLRAEIEKRHVVTSKMTDAMIEAGRGYENYTATLKAAANNDPLAISYIAAVRNEVAARDELDRRMKWHGGDKPIKVKYGF